MRAMPPGEKKFTVTWDESKEGVQTGKLQVDDLVLPKKGYPVYGFTQHQVDRLQKSGNHKFTVEEGDQTKKGKRGGAAPKGQEVSKTSAGTATPPKG